MVRKKNNGFFHKLNIYKEGLIIGGLTGALAAFYLVKGGYDLSSLYVSSKSVIDSLGRNSSVVELAVTKLYLVLISLGATIGYMFDRFITNNFLKNKSSLSVRRRR